MKEFLVSTVDFGSSKISASMGKGFADEFDIIGTKNISSRGIEKGLIVNKYECKKAFVEVMDALKFQSNEVVNDIYVGISSRNVRLTEDNIKITLTSGKVRNKDIKRALTKSKFNIELLEGEEVIDTIINYYMVDDKISYEEVVGWIGETLTINVSVVVGASDELNKFKEIVKEEGYNFKGFLLNSITSRNIFIQGSQSIGVKVLIDIGAEVTDISIFRNGVLKYIGSIPLGGNNITRDISICGEISMDEAEKIKKMMSDSYETVYNDDTISDELKFGKVVISKTLFYEVVVARLEEVLKYVNNEVKNTSFCEGMCSIIIYGNGITNYENIVDLVNKNIEIKTTVANKEYLEMRNTANITSLSMLKEVFDRLLLLESESKDNVVEELRQVISENNDEEIIEEVEDEEEVSKNSKGIFGKLKRFIREII